MNTSPISGMQEFLPARQAVFNKIKAKIEEVYHAHGFLSIETPTIDRSEILFAKAGGDTEKQIYKVIKTFESAEEADQALRFDHTVPLARYVVEHESDLQFPFTVTQIGKNFRGERAQKGRFREFYQCDVDVIGRGNLPIYYDARVISCFYDALSSFVKTPIVIRISNRKILAGFLEELGVSELAPKISSIIDHSEKVPAEVTTDALRELGLSEENVVKITTFMDVRGGVDALSVLEFLGISVKDGKVAFAGSDGGVHGMVNEKLREGVQELVSVMQDLSALGLGDAAVVDLRIVRGLDYYTGTVFEGALPEYPEVGSIGGGGRYDNLASHYTDQQFPGVGASIGLSRLFYILTENGLIDGAIADEKPVDVAIVPIDVSIPALRQAAYTLASALRAQGKIVDVVLTEKKLSDKLSFAAKIAKAGVVIGEDEVASSKYMIKDFATGKQSELAL